MKRMFMVAYKYRDTLDGDDFRHLTKKFLETGEAPGVIAHYERFDGRGGYFIREGEDGVEKAFELTLEYSPYLEFEVVPVTTIEEAFPIIQKVYG